MLTSIAGFLATTLPSSVLGDFVPSLKGDPQILGAVADPLLNRDSCGSVIMGSRALWTCRDTQTLQSDGTVDLSVVTSTASWTNLTTDGMPEVDFAFLNGYFGVLMMYGGPEESPYFPYISGECGTNSAGECNDGTRFAIWPDSPPMVVLDDGKHATAYTWIKQAHINGFAPAVNDPPVTLYRLDYTTGSNPNVLPLVSVVQANFWATGQADYGVYGNVVQNGIAYLYSQSYNKNVALARVRVDCVEDRASYEYWVDGQWTSSIPAVDYPGANIACATAGGQGTFYYSTTWNTFVWIGQSSNSIWADFYITTAPSPEGPWAEPIQFWSGANGNGTFPAYSLQAHPGLVNNDTNAVCLSYTRTDRINGNDIYTTPLIYVEWDDL